MFLTRVVLVCALSWAAIGRAQSNDSVCHNIANHRDVVRCAIENHPQARQSELLLRQNENLIGVAKQRPNPELNSQVLGGKAGGGDQYQYTQVNLAHTFELGGKRDARIERSNALVKNSGFEFKQTQEQVYLETYLAMVRLRQISSELAVYDDALTTFGRIQAQYRSRPRMTPEQRATYTIMDIAARDYRMRREPLLTEAAANRGFLEIAIGRKLDVRTEFFPELRKKWPTVADTSALGTDRSVAFQKSLTDLEVARAELKEAESFAWPDLKVGPTLESQATGSVRTNALGVNFGLAIPLFHTNGSGKAYAAAGVSRAETGVNQVRNALSIQRAREVERYRAAVKSMETSISLSDLEKRHKEIEESFSSGVISSTLIIEMHRQMADYTKSLSEQETTAVDALARILSIEGRLLSEGL